jgi:hypothetical protein
MSIDLILLIAAFICFVAAALGANVPRVGLVPAGLALWVLASIVG